MQMLNPEDAVPNTCHVARTGMRACGAGGVLAKNTLDDDLYRQRVHEASNFTKATRYGIFIQKGNLLFVNQ